ncbi:MAG TPA: DNA-3-methyladenine glycosylase 2 family protein [Streptosporangiaceae bacterium]|nr:DNA-3-methyladenine glycosylase 2 family protein [Streptosporangiaceae bacterium]
MTDLPASPPALAASTVAPDRDAGAELAVRQLDDGGLASDWFAPFSVDVRLTMVVHRHGPRDPTFRIDPAGALWRTALTPAGPGTLRLAAVAGTGPRAGVIQASGTVPASAAAPALAGTPGSRQPGTCVQATAWGPGARWLLAGVPDLLGARDDPAAFQPAHPGLRRLVQRFSGLRISRTGRVLEALVPAVLEQKVVGVEAHRAWRLLLVWHGLPAPGPAPAGMRVFPPPAVWQTIPSWDWHRAGAEAVRGRTIAGAAAVAGRLEIAGLRPAAEADRMLRSLAGIGPWTSAEIRQRAAGDPDAVSVGDYHIPALVGWTLAGVTTDDAGMLDMLAPYAGQRYRVTRLIELGGSAPPRRGPRMSVRDYRGL